VTLTVGFDLDMTLIDPRRGVRAAMANLALSSGLPLDAEYIADHLGPPLDSVLRNFGAPDFCIPDLVAEYRAGYTATVLPLTSPMPGAEAALAAVQGFGGRVLVVTAKHEPLAVRHLSALGWNVDCVVGDLWGAGKATALRKYGAGIYVGDHVSDVIAARAAGTVAVSVPTGPCDAEMLRTAGADCILSTLDEFPGWLRTQVG
jgi:phosphoglycolate phosphatase